MPGSIMITERKKERREKKERKQKEREREKKERERAWERNKIVARKKKF